MLRLVGFLSRLLPSRKGLRDIAQSVHSGNTGWGLGAGLLVYLLMYSSGWYLLAWVVLDFDTHSALKLVAVLSLSYVAGVVSLLPAGIAVREAAILFFGAVGNLKGVDMAAVAVLTRAAMMLIDIASTIAGATLLRASSFGQRPRHG